MQEALTSWDSLLSPEDFLDPCNEEVEEVMMSGAAVIGLPEGMHMLCTNKLLSRISQYLADIVWWQIWKVIKFPWYLRHHGRHVLWEAGALLPHPRHVRRLTWNATLRQPGNTKAVFPQIHCCNSHKSIFTDSHKGRGSFHTLLPQLELSAPKTLSMLRWKKAVNNKDGSSSSEIKVFHFHSAPTMEWRRIPQRLVKKWRKEGGKEGRSSPVTQCLCQLQCSSSAALSSSYQQRRNRFAVGAAAVHKYSYSF